MDNFIHDIERYKRGELSSSEMHALEMKALHDPFLAEALEGLDQLSPEDLSYDITELNKQLRSKTASKDKMVTIWGWSARIAAGMAIFAIATFVFIEWIAKHDKANEHLTLNSQSTSPIQDSLQNANAKLKAYQEQANELSSEVLASESATKQRSTPRTSKAPGMLKDEADDDERISTEELATGPLAEAALPEVAMPTRSELAPAASKAKRRASDKFIDAMPGVVRGQVLDADDGKGLPGVNVTIRGTNTGTVTDAEGFYEIDMDNLKEGLVFSFIGFESTEVVPGAGHEVNISLNQDVSQLSEVVVVGYGVKREDSFTETYPTVEMAVPAGGRKAFKQYLEKNLRYPEQALNEKVEGKVTIQFTVETSGHLSDFKILKGIGYGCDEEVIRLIKNGPGWTATKRNADPVRDKVKVRLRFALPKK